MIDFSKLATAVKSKQIHPRDIFMSLPQRNQDYKYPRDVQTEVWNKWFEQRSEKNNIIKMNTGAGKTVVALLILQSSMNENNGNAVYVVPDSYLVEQVCDQANKLGIATCTDAEDIEFKQKKAILVINIHKLINGMSIFGMRYTNNVDIDNIVIDDIHACLSKIEEQFTLKISKEADQEEYSALLKQFENSLKEQSESKFDEIQGANPYSSMLVPFWDWQSKLQETKKIIEKNKEKAFYKFNYSLIKENFRLARCFISASTIEIIPFGIPIDIITSFKNAKRRIFLSATLADDTVFSSVINILPEDIKQIITPLNANDIGDRMILSPSAINKDISDSEIREKIVEFSKKVNVIVIVPSFARAELWREYADLFLDASNLKEGINSIKQRKNGIAVIINKYDGIDLPDEACRLLVIDKLPPLYSQYDHFEKNALPFSKRLVNEFIQKIEQGMGRGVRSNSDYCGIILMGSELIDLIYASNGIDFFSPATKKQFEISALLWEQLKNKSINDIFNTFDSILTRDINWVQVSKDSLIGLKYSTSTNIDNLSLTIRRAYNCAETNQIKEAIRILEEYKNSISEHEIIGFLKQQIAEYTNIFNPGQAQELLLSAAQENKKLTRCINGIEFTKIVYKETSQAQKILKYCLDNSIDPNKYIIKISALLDNLCFGSSYNAFEDAIDNLAKLLGFVGQRPELEHGKGPDNFWCVGQSNYFVIECKNQTTTELIFKDDCKQINTSIQWFSNLYNDNSLNMTPILIHNSKIFEKACSPNPDIRIMTPDFLDKLKSSLKNFAESLSNDNAFKDPLKLQGNLSTFKLTERAFVENYTTKFKTKN